MIAIVDYGASNLRSVEKGLERVGYEARITDDPDTIRKAKAVVFPGDGAAATTMVSLRAKGLEEVIREAVASEKPFLGICLGLQLLLGHHEEGPTDCLGVIPGNIPRFAPGLKVPHMGWNNVEFRIDSPLFEGVPSGSYFYFVHSYYPNPSDPDVIVGETEYGSRFCSALQRGNIFGTQFHPEKSSDIGLRVLANFGRIVKKCS